MTTLNKNKSIYNYITTVLSSVYAGCMISIGCTIFLKSTNVVIGAILFSIALFCICYNKYNLFTGKVGYIISIGDDKQPILDVLLILIGNVIGTYLFSKLILLCVPEIYSTAQELTVNKINQPHIETLIKALFCGMLMFLAVDGFKKFKNPLFIFLCVTTFILCGFEHSIANIGYFSIGCTNISRALVHSIISIVGNSFGGVFFALSQNISMK